MAQGGNASAGCAADDVNLFQLRGSLDVKPHDVLVGVLPLFHIYGSAEPGLDLTTSGLSHTFRCC